MFADKRSREKLSEPPVGHPGVRPLMCMTDLSWCRITGTCLPSRVFVCHKRAHSHSAGHGPTCPARQCMPVTCSWYTPSRKTGQLQHGKFRALIMRFSLSRQLKISTQQSASVCGWNRRHNICSTADPLSSWVPCLNLERQRHSCRPGSLFGSCLWSDLGPRFAMVCVLWPHRDSRL